MRGISHSLADTRLTTRVFAALGERASKRFTTLGLTFGVDVSSGSTANVVIDIQQKERAQRGTAMQTTAGTLGIAAPGVKVDDGV